MNALPQTTAKTQRLTSLAEVAAFVHDWNDLLQRSKQATPFASPAWLLPWAQVFAPDRTQALALRVCGELVGWLPFFTWRGALLLAGTGPSDRETSLFADVESARIALAETAAAAAELDCDRIDLQQLSPASPLLAAPAPQGWRSEVSEGDACGLVYGLKLSSHRRKHLAYAERKLRRVAEIDVAAAPDIEIARAAETLETLHERRWIQRGERGMLADPLMHAFFRAALPVVHQAGLLRFYRLRADDEIIAALCALRLHDAEYFYLSGFDPGWAPHSPGAVLMAAALREAFALGARRVDFLRGEEAYKSHFGVEAEPTYRRVLRRISSRAG